MRGFLIYFLTFAVLSVFQATFLTYVFPTSSPALLIPFVVSALLYTDDLAFVFSLSVFAGLFQDLVSSSLFGLNMLVYLISCLVFSAFRRFFFQKGFPVWFLSVLVFDFFAQLFYTVLVLLAGTTLSAGLFASRFFWHIFYTALLTPFLFFPSIWALRASFRGEVRVR